MKKALILLYIVILFALTACTQQEIERVPGELLAKQDVKIISSSYISTIEQLNDGCWKVTIANQYGSAISECVYVDNIEGGIPVFTTKGLQSAEWKWKMVNTAYEE